MAGNTQGPDRIERAIAALRDGWPDMEALFMDGQCLTLALMLRAIWPAADILYSRREGHVYTRIDGRLYDIRGRHLVGPGDLVPLDWREGDRAHRWPRRDMRRLTGPAVLAHGCMGMG